MDEPMNTGVEGVATQSLVAMCQFGCSTCNSVVVARIPAMRVYNFPEVSGVVVGHERLQKCPKCQTMYVPLIKGVDNNGKIEWVWKPLPQQQQQQQKAETSIPELDAKPVKGRKQ